MKSLVGILVVCVLTILIYRFYLVKSLPQDGSTPSQTIDVVGVKNDIIGIAQAERTYQAEHGSYASMDQLVSSGALTMAKAGRAGYTYDVQSSASDFQVIARCTAPGPDCTGYGVDSSMEVKPLR
jgi:hypothetical protein